MEGNVFTGSGNEVVPIFEGPLFSLPDSLCILAWLTLWLGPWLLWGPCFGVARRLPPGKDASVRPILLGSRGIPTLLPQAPFLASHYNARSTCAVPDPGDWTWLRENTDLFLGFLGLREAHSLAPPGPWPSSICSVRKLLEMQISGSVPDLLNQELCSGPRKLGMVKLEKHGPGRLPIHPQPTGVCSNRPAWEGGQRYRRHSALASMPRLSCQFQHWFFFARHSEAHCFFPKKIFQGS